MPEAEEQLQAWIKEVEQYHLPLWEELPDIELYMDQVITLIERYLAPLVGQTDNKVITSAMINNYVKLNIMPKPNKKRYERLHMAYLIVITILKQVLLIPEIKNGIFLQSRHCSLAQAYDLFCQEQENALHTMASKHLTDSAIELTVMDHPVNLNTLGLHMACTSFASKIFTEKIIILRMEEQNHLEQKN